MKLYTCCPHEECGAFQNSLNWLESWGIEPALEHDGEHHYFEFEVPDYWDKEKRIEFRWELCKRTSGLVFCRCGLWLDEGYGGEAYSLRCKGCGREYLFCMACQPIDDWDGCECGEDQPVESWTLMKDGKPISVTVEEVCGLLHRLIEHEQLFVFDPKSGAVMSSVEELTVTMNGPSIQITVAH